MCIRDRIKPGDKVTIVEPSVYPDELVNPLCAELEKYPMVGAAYLQTVSYTHLIGT